MLISYDLNLNPILFHKSFYGLSLPSFLSLSPISLLYGLINFYSPALLAQLHPQHGHNVALGCLGLTKSHHPLQKLLRWPSQHWFSFFFFFSSQVVHNGGEKTRHLFLPFLDSHIFIFLQTFYPLGNCKLLHSWSHTWFTEMTNCSSFPRTMRAPMTRTFSYKTSIIGRPIPDPVIVSVLLFSWYPRPSVPHDLCNILNLLFMATSIPNNLFTLSHCHTLKITAARTCHTTSGVPVIQSHFLISFPVAHSSISLTVSRPLRNSQDINPHWSVIFSLSILVCIMSHLPSVLWSFIGCHPEAFSQWSPTLPWYESAECSESETNTGLIETTKQFPQID